MTTVSAPEAARTFDALLARVRAGESVSIADAGREVARLVPARIVRPTAAPTTADPPIAPAPARPDPRRMTPEEQADRDAWFEELRQFRESMNVTGEPMSEIVIRARREARY